MLIEEEIHLVVNLIVGSDYTLNNSSADLTLTRFRSTSLVHCYHGLVIVFTVVQKKLNSV